MTKMNPEVKTKWLAALRSGEYKQVTSVLCNGTGFCCLGVATDLFIKETGVGGWEKLMDGVYDLGTTFASENEREEAVLPEEVRVWAGLSKDVPEVKVHREHYGTGFEYYKEYSDGRTLVTRSVADLNDNGMSFADIADLIEEQL